ncbi:MAG: UDP-glucose dehydrogenase family protein [Microbacteriaceae bacterium]
MAKIGVVGVGYVGLCTSAGLAKIGHEVHSFDIVPARIESLRAGRVPIFEHGLTELVAETMAERTLTFHLDLAEAVNDAEFVFLCVPTPQDEDGAADLSHVLSAAKQLSPLLASGATVVVKSTVPVGAAGRMRDALARDDIHYVSNPEFLREGSAMSDFFHPERIVVGSDDAAAARAVAALYQQPEVPVVVTSPSSAELIKYAANSFLAIKLSFVNEVAAICERTGADITDVMRGFGLDSRIGEKFLRPGPGWGGSCFPKDTRALLATSENLGVSSALVQAAVSSNERTFHRIVERLAASLGGGFEGTRIAVWGIAFKANTDDIRESPAISIMARLIGRGAEVVAYDPVATLPPQLAAAQAASAQEAVHGADALMVLTEWDEFAGYDAAAFVPALRRPLVFDTRRILNESWNQDGIQLVKVGR